MKSFDEYEQTATKRPPFSNGTSWDIWNYNVCGGGGDSSLACVNDRNRDCVLITVGFCGMTPAEWTGPDQRYDCSDYTPEEIEE
jgi:hypothetical protein